MTKTMARCSHLFAVVALVVCAATARAEVVSLDGTWQAEVAQDAQGDAIPAAFTRTAESFRKVLREVLKPVALTGKAAF